ncbi:transcriptional regulator [Nanohaloarchaea archaeon H12]|jgi:DNA-binding HxlR family transcriptional regulator|nr:transcriptional regulator [Nanohaloarchaea archaeon H12]
MTNGSDKIPVSCAGEDWCPLTATANILSKKWHPVIINELLESESMGFNELKDRVGGISSKVLSESLGDLEDKQVVNREVISEKPFRVKYTLTDIGKDLEPILDDMQSWGKENLREVREGEESAV